MCCKTTVPPQATVVRQHDLGNQPTNVTLFSVGKHEFNFASVWHWFSKRLAKRLTKCLASVGKHDFFWQAFGKRLAKPLASV
jgi:hypothetical protein